MPILSEFDRADLLERVVDAAPVGILLTNSQGQICLVNRGIQTMFGYEAADLGGQSVELLIPLHRAAAHQRDRQAYLGAPETRRMGAGRDLVGRCKDGSELPVEIGLNPIVLGGEQFILAIVMDIRERKRAEQVAQDREARLRAFMSNASDGVSILDGDGIILETNPRMGEILGREPRDLVRRKIEDFLSPTKRQETLQRFDALLAVGGGQDRDVELVRPDGSISIVDFSLSTVMISGQRLVFTIGREVTRERSLQRQLFQAQRLESIGRVVGGVAHDFNNLLTVINGNAEIVASRLDTSDPNREDVGEIINASRRAEALTRQLLAFSRQQVLEPKVFELGQLLLGMEKMLNRVIGEDVVLQCKLDPNGGRVLADPGQIEQVVMNLVVNARDALEGNGSIVIETLWIDLDQEYASRHADAAPGPHVMLSVTDTGSGMSAEIQARIFEPFFTTKEQGKGTGLGLSTVYGIVKQSGGHIWVYSEVGQGTTFKIYLPRVESKVEEGRARSVAEVAGGHETILLVEDDPSVRRLAVGILEQKGYLVLTSDNGRHALDMVRGRVAGVDLLVTDVVMPEMSGPVLAKELRKLWPDLRVLYVSGYTDSTISRHGLEPGEAFLQKPFSVDALARRVRSILDGFPRHA